MKRYLIILCTVICCIGLLGCSQKDNPAQIVATTLPVFDFTQRICAGTDLEVTRLINDDIACLHDYSLQVNQVKALESAEIILSSGAGLEVFLEDIEANIPEIVDLSIGIPLLQEGDTHHHEEAVNHHEEHTTADPHYWLSPSCSKIMAENICKSLTKSYPQYQGTFETNLTSLIADLDKLQEYADTQLTDISNRKLITFHDGFSYMADAFDLEIAHCVAEESGSEASAQELITLVNLVEKHNIPAIFTETNGSTSAANIIASETNIKSYSLDMAISADSYFETMYHNIDTLKEALE